MTDNERGRELSHSKNMDGIYRMLAAIEAKRAAMDPADRAALEADELGAQRESWIRAMGPCEHGDYDWETCSQCRSPAQGIEARRADIGIPISVHESPVPQGCARTPAPKETP